MIPCKVATFRYNHPLLLDFQRRREIAMGKGKLRYVSERELNWNKQLY